MVLPRVKRCTAIITVVITLVLMTVAFRFVQVRRGNILAQQAVGELLNALKDSDEVRVQQLLSDEARQQLVPLKSLNILVRTTDPTLSTEPIALRRFWSNHVAVAVPLTTATGQETLVFDVRPVQGAYSIESLPLIVAHPAALVRSVTSSTAKIAAYGIEHEVTTPSPLIAGEVGLVVSIDRRMVHFSLANITSIGRVLRYSRGGLFEGEVRAGNLAKDAEFYSVVPGRTPEVVRLLLPGTPGIGIVEWDGSIYAAVATERFVPDNIRVVLNTTDYLKLTHDEVVLSSPVGLRLVDKIGSTSMQVPPLAVVRLARGPQGIVVTYLGRETLVASHRIFVEPLTETGRTTLRNISRALGIPAYRGTIEVSLSGQPQGLLVVNEVLLNEYLYSVVPSEMPVSFGLEALKAQALAARA
ncbi:MAG: SpoIID/LytB domain-containing protein, partial [Bacillota bacterium]|nr:SpoIID/LytB domain-containing protein [Bacillota bacterium]